LEEAEEQGSGTSAADDLSFPDPANCKSSNSANQSGGRGVAWQWRIRHKLMLGLGLVVCILALVVVGTFLGLASYRSTTKIIDSRLVELAELSGLKEALNSLFLPVDETNDEVTQLLTGIAKARGALNNYRARLEETVRRNRDPEHGDNENGLAQAIEVELGNLEKGIDEAKKPRVRAMGETVHLRGDPVIGGAIRALRRACDQLHESIYTDLYDRIEESRGHYTSSLILVLSTSIGGVLLMAGLLRFFYRWTFSPIRDLQQGVHRVAEGDFDHPIEVHSGDEMEQLAAAFNDMTRRLHEMYTDLEQQVNERSRQLVRSERLASLGFLAAGVAHEINNPLASIAFCSEALERRLSAFGQRMATASGRPASPSPPVVPHLRLVTETDEQLDGRKPKADGEDWEVIARYLKMIQEESFRCKQITQRLLEFGRGGERRREPANIADLIQSVLDMVQHLETSKGKQITFETESRPTAWVNAQELKSVVLNLVVNALESMEEGGALTIRLGQRERMAELVFTDTGCGMNAEVLENIFEPFFTRSRTGKGTGLGLSISHRIINQHGGEIEATSAGPGHGSTFLVRLPLRPAETVKEDSLGHAAA
jgi:two-component system NtrC family sensor kinase